MLEAVLLLYSVLSVLAFFAYGGDKRRAKRKRRRTPEAALLLTGICGGAAGALLGMSFFRHKTRHWYFWAVNLIALAGQAMLAWALK